MAMRQSGQRMKWHGRLAAVCCAAAIGLTCLKVSPAAAQTPDAPIHLAQSDNRGFNPFRTIRRLFRNEGRVERNRPSRSQSGARSNRPSAASRAPAVVIEPKDPNAGVILVVGDRMARGVADGLRNMLAKQPMIRVDTVTEDTAGLAGEAPPDWATQVLSKIRGEDVKAVVVMMGRRDLGKTIPGDPPLEFMTEAWLAAYRDKVETLVRTVRRERKPIVWVGLPPTNTQIMNTDFTTLNGIFRAANSERRARYIDLWDIFLSDAGRYTSFGPDVEGTRRRLRSQNRIGFTGAGYQKVAFFVERELLRLLGGYGGLAFEGVEDDPNFIVLTGRTTSPEAELLGGDARMPDPDTNSETYRFLVLGEPLAPVPGRVDSTLPLEMLRASGAPPPVGAP